MESTPEELKKERFYIIVLSAIQIVHILDFVIMMPLGATFMRVFEITPVQFSTLVSAYTISAGVVGFFGALYADHFDRKKFLLFNFAGFIFGTFMCAVAPGFAALLTARIIAGAFGGVLNACILSLVADLIPFQRRGAALGVVMSSFSIASVAGVPLGLYIATLFNWHAAFYFICIVATIFWFASMILLPSVKPKSEPRSFSANLRHFGIILKRWDYLQSFLLTSVLAFGMFMIIPFLAPYMVMNVGLKEAELPLIYLIGGAFTIVSARFIGKLTDKKGSFSVFRTVALISMVPIIILTNLPAVPLWVALTISTPFTMFVSGRFIPALNLVSAVVTPLQRGTFMSLENSFRQLSTGISSQFAGLIIGSTATGALTHFNVAGAIGVLSTLLAIYIASRIGLKLGRRPS
jgi:predicted MFS family arabinose efflux permease